MSSVKKTVRKTVQKLNEKQIRFCQEYVIDLNATQAAIRAGYSSKTAYSQGQRLLKHVEAKQVIDKLRAKKNEKLEITAERVLAELAKIGFADTGEFINGNNQVKEIKFLDKEKTAAIESVSTVISPDGRIQTKIKLHDKVAALEKLGRHLGIFEKDNSQKRDVIKVTVKKKGEAK